MHKFQLAQCVPFSPNSIGAKVPDDNTAPSVAYYTVDEFSMSGTYSSPSGIAFVSLFLPMQSNVQTWSATNTANTWTWAAAYGNSNATTKKTALAAEFELSRPVGWGVRVSCPTAKLNAQGYIHVCYVPMTFTGGTWTAPLGISDMQNMPGYHRIAMTEICEQVTTIQGKYYDSSAFIYRTTDVTVPAFQDATPIQLFGWYGILVAIDGNASTSTLNGTIQCEVIIHWEGQTKNTGTYAIAGSTKHEPGNAPVMSATANAVANTQGVITATEIENDVIAQAEMGSALRQGVELTADVASLVVHPAAGRFIRGAAGVISTGYEYLT